MNKEFMCMKENKRVYMGGFGGEKGRNKFYNIII